MPQKAEIVDSISSRERGARVEPITNCPPDAVEIVAHLRWKYMLKSCDKQFLKKYCHYLAFPVKRHLDDHQKLKAFAEAFRKEEEDPFYESTFQVDSSFPKPQLVKKMVQKKYNAVWNSDNILYRVNLVPHEELVLLNLDFLPDAFFRSASISRHADEIQNVTSEKEKLPSGWTPMPGVHMAMKFLDENESSCCRLGEDDLDSALFGQLLATTLRRHGYQRSPTNEMCFKASILKTLKERFQQPHCDYEHKLLFDRHSNLLSPVPWAVDLPLADGGLELLFWHDFNLRSSRLENNYNNMALRVRVPFGWVLLWRGDLVHAGGLQNQQANGAVRMHMYLSTQNTLDQFVVSRTARIETNFPPNHRNQSLLSSRYDDDYTPPPEPKRRKSYRRRTPTDYKNNAPSEMVKLCSKLTGPNGEEMGPLLDWP